MALTLELETLFLETLNTSWIFPIISKVHFVKGLANSILTYVPNMIHICPNTAKDFSCHVKNRTKPTLEQLYFVWSLLFPSPSVN